MAPLRIPAAFLLIAIATLIPFGGSPPRFDRHLDPSDALINLVLFIPLGAALMQAGRRRVPIAGIALLLSTLIELTQGTLIPGRQGNPYDVLFNTLGALAGTWLPTGSMVAVAVPALAWLASGPALSPCVPRTERWWGQWSHQFAGTVPFGGVVREVTFEGAPAPDGPLDPTPPFQTRAEREGWALDVLLTTGTPPEGLAHLAGVSDGEGNTLIALEQRGKALQLSWRSRGACGGMRTARWVVPGELPDSPGVPLQLTARVRPSRADVVIARGGQRVSRRVWLGPWAGWRSLAGTPLRSRQLELGLTGLWGLAGLGLLLAWLRRLRPAASRS